MNFINYGQMNGSEAAKLFQTEENKYTQSIEDKLNEKKQKIKEYPSNGYVNLSSVENCGQKFNLYNEQTNGNNLYSEESMKNVFCKSKLSNIYFSSENINLLHDIIRYQVYVRSNKNHVIGRQSDVELKIIMRSIYLQYGKNLPTKIKEQVAELNELVVNECIDPILSAVEQYYGYLKNISEAPVPLARSVNMSTKGSKTLQENHFF